MLALLHSWEQGDVIIWRNNSVESISAREYIAQLQAKIEEYEEREKMRLQRGDGDPLVEYMKSLDEHRLEELANGASEEVLLAMHICCDEFLGHGDEDKGPMTCSLPQKEMSRLMEWLMTFGYNLRCKEIKHEMERAFNMTCSPNRETPSSS